MSSGGGTRAVVAALLANLGIAVTKFIAFALTGSSSMLAEAIHSVADSGNQVLLLFGGRRALRRATPQHPFGYGRERYIYAFIVSIVLFSVGGLFALYEAYHKFQHPEAIESWKWLPILVLLVAITLESFSFRTAIHESNVVRGKVGWLQFIRRSKAPELPVILLEDFAALLGLIFALFGVSMTLATHDGRWDALGSAMIGVLLVTVAVTLALETKSLLLGEAANAENIRAIERAITAGRDIERIIHLRTLHLGPEELLVAVKIGIPQETTAEGIARSIDAAEERIREAVPIARVIYIEPDIYRPASAARSSGPDKGGRTPGAGGREGHATAD